MLPASLQLDKHNVSLSISSLYEHSADLLGAGLMKAVMMKEPVPFAWLPAQ